MTTVFGVVAACGAAITVIGLIRKNSDVVQIGLIVTIIGAYLYARSLD